MTTPIIRCPGGKRALASRILDLIPSTYKFDTYLEPFAGGAAVYLHAKTRGLLDDTPIQLLGDADRDLIALYAAIRDNPHEVYRDAADYVDEITAAKDPKAAYNKLREYWNVVERQPALTLALRSAAFNGLFRMNQKGELNTPPRDKLDELRVPKLPTLLAFADAIADVELLDWDFRQYEQAGFEIGEGTFVYLDPPYDGEGSFTAYTADGFDEDDQIDLIQQARAWSDRGAFVVYSNANTPNVDEWLKTYWPTATITHIEAKRSISADGDSRAPVTELLVHSERRSAVFEGITGTIIDDRDADDAEVDAEVAVLSAVVPD